VYTKGQVGIARCVEVVINRADGDGGEIGHFLSNTEDARQQAAQGCAFSRPALGEVDFRGREAVGDGRRVFAAVGIGQRHHARVDAFLGGQIIVSKVTDFFIRVVVFCATGKHARNKNVFLMRHAQSRVVAEDKKWDNRVLVGRQDEDESARMADQYPGIGCVTGEIGELVVGGTVPDERLVARRGGGGRLKHLHQAVNAVVRSNHRQYTPFQAGRVRFLHS